MSTAIEFSNISKQYSVGLVSTKTLSYDLNRWWQRSALSHEDPYFNVVQLMTALLPSTAICLSIA